jgi:hypothetical protein
MDVMSTAVRWSAPACVPPRVSLIQWDACCTPCRPVTQPVQRLLEASRFSQFCRRFALPSFCMLQACTSTMMCWQFRSANLGDQKRLQKDTLHLQRSSNKLSPTPRLHTRIWEWMISAVGKEWAVASTHLALDAEGAASRGAKMSCS